MNELTKEELHIIMRAVNFYLGENSGKQIKDKIQLIIDRYCQHEYLCIMNESGHGFKYFKVCRKCGKNLNE